MFAIQFFYYMLIFSICIFRMHYLIFKHNCYFPVVEFDCVVYIIVCRCMVAFPDDYKNLVPKLLIETMAAVGSSFVSRVNSATGNVVPETKALAKGFI